MNDRYTIAIATGYSERRSFLIATLRSLETSSVDPTRIDVLVDGDDEYFQQLRRDLESADRCSLVELVQVSPRCGTTGVWNLAIDRCRTPLLIFLDDDARPRSPDWARSLVACLDDPLVVAARGRVEPLWEGRCPGWLPESLYWALGVHVGPPISGRRVVKAVVGANMALRVATVREAGPFSSHYARRADGPPGGCDDIDMSLRLISNPGWLIVETSGAEVDHCVPPHRLSGSYLARRCYYEGAARSRLMRDHGLAALHTTGCFELRRRSRARPRSLIRGSVALLGLAAVTVGFTLESVRHAITRALRFRRGEAPSSGAVTPSGRNTTPPGIPAARRATPLPVRRAALASDRTVRPICPPR